MSRFNLHLLARRVALRLRSWVSLSPKELAIEDAFRVTRTNGVKGHYLEFGVFQGKTSSVAAYLLRRYNMEQVHLYLFDSFRGMPDYAVAPFYKGQYATSRAIVERNLRQSGIAPSRVHLIEGWFEDTLPPPWEGDRRSGSHLCRLRSLSLDAIGLSICNSPHSGRHDHYLRRLVALAWSAGRRGTTCVSRVACHNPDNRSRALPKRRPPWGVLSTEDAPVSILHPSAG